MFNLFKPKKANLDDFLAEATPYGSRMWGGAMSNSDYDYLLHSDHYKPLIKYLEKNKIKYKRDNSYNPILGNDHMVTFTANDKEYQFIFFKRNYKNMKATFELINSYTKNRPVGTKEARKSLVEDFYAFLVGDIRRPFIVEFLQENHPEYLI